MEQQKRFLSLEGRFGQVWVKMAQEGEKLTDQRKPLRMIVHLIEFVLQWKYFQTLKNYRLIGVFCSQVNDTEQNSLRIPLSVN